MPIRRTRSGCCARAASGHTAAPQTIVMKSRRLIASPEAQTEHRNCSNWRARRGRNAAMSALGQKQTLGRVCVMSALPPKADIDCASRDVRFVPKADIGAIRSASGQKRIHFTRKLKPYLSKTDFAGCVRKNDKYCAASDLAFAVNATG